jgi:hypothetical protein
MTDQDKRCGTCKWFDKAAMDFGFGDTERGWCAAPVPESVCIDYREPMVENDGAECQCWEAKDEC